jgi:hypothetical protein
MKNKVQQSSPALSDTIQPRPKKLKMPMALRLVQWVFPHVEKVAPSVAKKWFVKLFFSPPRYPIPAVERKFIDEAERFEVTIWGKVVSCYRWGEGPLIIFVHGWAGRASQFKTFIPFFTNAGFQVISFDAPAHGLTRGTETTIIDFKNTMLAIEKNYGKPHAVVAHSLGGAASLFAITEGMNIETLVTLSTPTVGDSIIQEFSQRLGASSALREKLKAHIQHRLHRPFDEFMASHFVKQLKPGLRWLIIHDENDKEAPLDDAFLLKNLYPNATLHMTSGLGHVRILKDEHVIKKSLAFVVGDDRIE